MSETKHSESMNQTFTEHVYISRAEWILLRKLRMVVENRYGTLLAKVDEGKITDIWPTPYASKEELKAAQV